MKKYTYYEFEMIDHMYNEQFTYQSIADSCNHSFHNDEKVRTVRSISYAVKKLYEDPNCLDFDYWDEKGLIE